jgi:hypothetical protein
MTMRYQSGAPYRGFSVDIQVTACKSLCLHNAGRRFKVSWTIDSTVQSARKIASFPERLEFISEADAFRYAEGRAHTFIDGMFSVGDVAYIQGERKLASTSASHPEA